MSADPLGSGRLRRAALDTWRADPSRLRQDANLEEDHARGYHRDRVLVELAQNAADAADDDGGGRLLLRLSREQSGWVLLAANTGTPLSAAGLAAMAAMRASAKAAGVGRFGMGFSAVRSVSDEIGVVSGAAAVRFSLTATTELLTRVFTGARQRPGVSSAGRVNRSSVGVGACSDAGRGSCSIGTLPLDPARRRVAEGPVTAHLVDRAAELYLELAAGTDDPLALVPAGLPAGPLDAALRESVTAGLARAEILTEVGTGQPVAPRAAHALTGPLGQDPAVLRALAPLVAGLVHVPASRRAAARTLGVAEQDPADVVDTLPTPGADELHALYDAVAPHVPTEREALLGLPVLLADGRVARGARGTVLVTGAVPDVPGLRVVAPAATHPVLRALGAVEADPVVLLDRPEVRAAAQDGQVAAVLGPVADAVVAGLDVPGWLGTLPLPTADGDVEVAGRLTVPGSWAEQVLTGLAPVAADVLATWGLDVLRAVGVRAGLRVRTLPDVVADPLAADEPVEGWAEYLADVAATCGEGSYLGELAVVADLDAVDDDAWDELLHRLTADPSARAALLAPVRAGRATVPSYTAWWLRAELGAPFVHPGRDAALPFLPPAPAAVAGLDDDVLRALGAVATAADLDPAAWQSYVDSWPAGGDEVRLAAAAQLWRGLARAARDGVRLEPPARVPVLGGGRARLVDAEGAVVGPPMWAQVRPVVPAPAEDTAGVTELLDLDLPAAQPPAATGRRRAVTPAVVRELLPTAPGEWWECAELAVGGHVVDWWVRDGEVWATTTAGLARALALAAGDWAARYAVETLLAEPARLAEVLVERVGE